jgi:hypothetical protein
VTHADFKIMLERRIEMTVKVLDQKSAEYSTADDKLHNFKKAANLTGQKTAQACLGMMVKHLVSVVDIVSDPSKFSIDQISEKIGDSINYLILLEAILREGSTQ